MGRNIALQILRGLDADIPALVGGEFYLATDKGQLYVGFNGFNFKLGGPAMANVVVQGSTNPNHFIEPNADGSVNVASSGGALSLDGTDATGVVGPSGATGIRGWLSSIFQQMSSQSAAKGTLASLVLSVQEPKDIGRTFVILYADRVAGVTAETLMNVSINKGGVVTTGTSYTVSAGKTLRIQSINAEILNTTTVANRVLIRLRHALSGSVSVASPVVSMAMAASQAALAASGDTDPHTISDGLEIGSGQQIGISQLCTVTTAGVVSAIVVGYEY